MAEIRIIDQPAKGRRAGLSPVVLLCFAALGFAGLETSATAQESSASPASFGLSDFPMSDLPRGPEEPPSTDPRNFRGIWRLVREPGSVGPNPLPAQYTEKAQAYLGAIKVAQEQGKVPGLSWSTCRGNAYSTAVSPYSSFIVVQSPDQIAILIEETRGHRQVFLDREHLEGAPFTYAGRSVGRWEGNTLVIDTVGVVPGEMNSAGNPFGPQARMIERLTKSADGKSVEVDIQVEDPEYYAEPLRVKRRWQWAGGERHTESDCAESADATDPVHTVYFRKLYQPSCLHVEGVGEEPSRVICTPRRKEDDAE